MTSAQIKTIIRLIDFDKSGDINQGEWYRFYEFFWIPFKTCDL